jgi:hypothetical protein
METQRASSHWTNRNINSSVNGRDILLNLWEKFNLEFADDVPTPMRTIFYDSANVIIIIVD